MTRKVDIAKELNLGNFRKLGTRKVRIDEENVTVKRMVFVVNDRVTGKKRYFTYHHGWVEVCKPIYDNKYQFTSNPAHGNEVAE